MSEGGGAGAGLLLLCCLTWAPFGFGLLLGWLVRGRVVAHGWLGLLPKFLRERIIYEP